MRSPRRPAVVTAVLAVVGLLLAACGGGGNGTASGSPSGPTAPSTYGASTIGSQQYVALGDSYTAAAGIRPQVAGDAGCLRSQVDYPHLLAQQVKSLALDDVSCSGATTDSVLHGQTLGTTTLPAQTDALSEDTKLVTIGIGGNDQSLFTTLIGGCISLAQKSPKGDPCTQAGTGIAQSALASIKTADDALVAEVKKQAPNARIVVVGYPQPLPSSGTCSTIAPIAAGDYAFVNRVIAGLSTDLQDAAQAHGADFVDVAKASLGHDLCSTSPWINGVHTAADGAIPFHPLPPEQQAVAAMIARLLS